MSSGIRDYAMRKYHSSILFKNRWLFVIVLSLIVGVILSIGFYFSYGGDRDSFWFGFYQSWIAGFVGFMCFGLASIAVSLRDVKKENLITRIGVLVRDAPDIPLVYVTQAVEKLGCYNEIVTRSYKIKDYNEIENSFEIEVNTTTKLRNFISDHKCVDVSKIFFELSDDDYWINADEDHSYLCLSSYIIGGEKYIHSPIHLSAKNPSYHRQERFSIEANGRLEISSDHSGWYKAGVNHSLSFIRYTHHCEVIIENKCKKLLDEVGSVSVEVEVFDNKNTSLYRSKLKYGDDQVKYKLENLYPSDDVYYINLRKSG